MALFPAVAHKAGMSSPPPPPPNIHSRTHTLSLPHPFPFLSLHAEGDDLSRRIDETEEEVKSVERQITAMEKQISAVQAKLDDPNLPADAREDLRLDKKRYLQKESWLQDKVRWLWEKERGLFEQRKHLLHQIDAACNASKDKSQGPASARGMVIFECHYMTLPI